MQVYEIECYFIIMVFLFMIALLYEAKISLLSGTFNAFET